MNSILQGPCDEGEIFTLDWDTPHSVQCNAICEPNEVSLKQGLIGGLLTCPDGKQLDTRGVCKDVISASDIFNNRLVLKCRFLKKSLIMNAPLLVEHLNHDFLVGLLCCTKVKTFELISAKL